MPSPVRQLVAVRHLPDRPADSTTTTAPGWDDVVAAIRRMDDHVHPVVQLNCTDYEDDDSVFNVIGGNGRFALFHMTGDWQYSDPAGSDEVVWLWSSGQGYRCARRNVLTDVDKVLRIVEAYYRTGSYDGLDALA